jgi:hypothetical protein
MKSTNASDAYRAARERLDERLKQLDRALRAHGARQFRDQKTWGYSGDLNYVADLIGNALEGLAGAVPTPSEDLNPIVDDLEKQWKPS